MSNDQQPQEHPGPEWVEIQRGYGLHPHFVCPGTGRVILYDDSGGNKEQSREQAVLRCKQYSAAALEWEFRRGVSFGQGLANASNFQHLIRGLAQ